MRDFAVSDHPAVQAQLDRLAGLSLPRGRLSLAPTHALLSRLGDPHERLPPVFHVAGTNGKGSTCAFLRAALEAAGHRVHVYTSPHLVRFNERIRLAGRLIDDDLLANLLEEVLDAASGIDLSFFEATTAAAFLAFARTAADACVVEVGLGGRLDATNVIREPVVCGIASLGLDHEAFLLAPEVGAPDDPMRRIAWEKAGIAKHGVPLVTLGYASAPAGAVAEVAAETGAPLFAAGSEWSFIATAHGLRVSGPPPIELPVPRLPGTHQAANYALATMMLRRQARLAVSETALRAAASARWPARLQRLGQGPLTALISERTIWLDGGHNRDAGEAVASAVRDSSRAVAGKAALHLIVGMLSSKEPRAIIEPLAPGLKSVTAVPIPGHESHSPKVFQVLAEEAGIPFTQAHDVADALRRLPHDSNDVLIAGSLYLAGKVLRANGEAPD